VRGVGRRRRGLPRRRRRRASSVSTSGDVVLICLNIFAEKLDKSVDF
jgi:hypothetical protein